MKRNADARLEVVTAEDVGKLPAHNVADALRGLPGVNISSSSADEGGFDESDRVSLRGTSPSLTQTLINGHSVGSADWFVLSQGNNVGRSVSYTLLPSELVNSVEVNKSSHASVAGRRHHRHRQHPHAQAVSIRQVVYRRGFARHRVFRPG